LLVKGIFGSVSVVAVCDSLTGLTKSGSGQTATDALSECETCSSLSLHVVFEVVSEVVSDIADGFFGCPDGFSGDRDRFFGDDDRFFGFRFSLSINHSLTGSSLKRNHRVLSNL